MACSGRFRLLIVVHRFNEKCSSVFELNQGPRLTFLFPQSGSAAFKHENDVR